MYTGISRSSRARAQHLPGSLGRDVERVLFAARRMIGWEVQCVEVELLGLELRALGQLPAHRDERVGDVLGQNRDGMPRTDRLARRGQRDVDAFGHQDRGVAFDAQRRETLVVGILRVGAGHVDQAPGIGTLGLG
jgi:hypothetical protein